MSRFSSHHFSSTTNLSTMAHASFVSPVTHPCISRTPKSCFLCLGCFHLQETDCTAYLSLPREEREWQLHFLWASWESPPLSTGRHACPLPEREGQDGWWVRSPSYPNSSLCRSRTITRCGCGSAALSLPGCTAFYGEVTLSNSAANPHRPVAFFRPPSLPPQSKIVFFKGAIVTVPPFGGACGLLQDRDRLHVLKGPTPREWGPYLNITAQI